MSTEIVCVIDKSGSMNNITRDAIGGFNNFLENQKQLPGEAKMTLVLFADEANWVHYRVPLQQVQPLTDKTYVPMGSTALYDAVGATIDKLGCAYTADATPPEKVVFVILTDGEENASKEYRRDQIAAKIKHQTENYGWEFIFLAANQDAFAAGGGLNINAANTVQFSATAEGMATAYADINARTTAYRINI